MPETSTPPPAARTAARSTTPLVVAAHMGYGHLRAALPLAESFGADVLLMDQPPLATDHDAHTWASLQRTYDRLSRRAGWPLLGPLDRRLLEWITRIPRLRPAGAQTKPNLAARYLHSLLAHGFGHALVERLRHSGAPLLATFYAPAIVADAAGVAGHLDRGTRIVSVLTDADVNRVWAPMDAARASIVYAVPTARAARRLRAFGVPADCIHRTGFPLPDAIASSSRGDAGRARLAARLRRLDPRGMFHSNHSNGSDAGAAAAGDRDDHAGRARRGASGRRPAADADPASARGPIEAAFAVGGAGAQVELASRLVRSLGPRLRDGSLRMTLVAGTREDTAHSLTTIVRRAGLASEAGGPLDVLYEPTFAAYARRFHRRLTEIDVLWTKPSEMTFFAAAGFSLALTTPLGDQEHANRAWAMRLGAALDAGDVRRADRWLDAHLADGSLARVAWSASERMPREGAQRIVNLVSPAPRE